MRTREDEVFPRASHARMDRIPNRFANRRFKLLRKFRRVVILRAIAFICPSVITVNFPLFFEKTDREREREREEVERSP